MVRTKAKARLAAFNKSQLLSLAYNMQLTISHAQILAASFVSAWQIHIPCYTAVSRAVQDFAVHKLSIQGVHFNLLIYICETKFKI